jgi:PAS domain S-box-containing protein
VLNLNKLFPRLSIRAKLGIGFAAVSGIPLLVVGTLGGLSALIDLADAAEQGLVHDLSLVHQDVSGALLQVHQHVSFLAELGIAADSGDPAGEAALAVAETYLVADSSALFRVMALDGEGNLARIAQRPDTRVLPPNESGQPLYHFTALGLEAGGYALLPVELEARTDPGEPLEVRPAVAVVLPVIRDGEYAGAVVGEADAESLFPSLTLASPGLEGTSALAQSDGHLLYHTDAKAHWDALMGEATLQDHVGDSVAALLIESDSAGILRAGSRGVVTHQRVELGASSPLVLYRVVPLTGLLPPVRRFLLVYSGVGMLLLVIVLGISVVASKQITRPIYRLREAARNMARGEHPGELRIESNDELEDLAADFTLMANTLEAHRYHLQTLVEDRTRKLVETQEELRQVVTMSADAIVGLDTDERVRLWNLGAEATFGYSADEARGRILSSLIGPGAGERLGEAAFFAEALEQVGAVTNFRTVRRSKSGEEIPTTITTTALLGEDGALTGYSVVLRDDRGREMLEEQMRKSERLSAISVMAAGLAHELNNPLSVLGNRIELMRREAVAKGYDEHVQRDLEVLGKHVGRIGSVTGDLLRFARDEAEEFVAVDANAVVERVGRLMNRIFVSADLDLKLDLAPQLPPILGSESVVETTLVNLLLNAQQATPPGGTVTVVTRRDPDDAAVEVEVVDTGPGIPDDLRVRIFEPFFTTKAERGGTGLGLAVCRTLVDRCGGRIWTNGRHTGASFVMSFPQQANGHP